MKTQHTPGPWTVGQYTPSAEFLAIRNHACVCLPDMSLIALTGLAEDRQSQIDADLISAAPDLLASLVQALNFIEHSEANRGKLTNDAEWDANVDKFRAEGPSAIGIGRSYTDKARIDLAACRAAIAKAKGITA